MPFFDYVIACRILADIHSIFPSMYGFLDTYLTNWLTQSLTSCHPHKNRTKDLHIIYKKFLNYGYLWNFDIMVAVYH